MTREERAIEMRNRAFQLVKSRGMPSGQGGMREYVKSGMTIQHNLFFAMHRLNVGTKAGKVLIVEWENSGKFRVLTYIPGLWETQLKYLTRAIR